MIKIVWTAAYFTLVGPAYVDVGEPTRFPDMPACHAYGDRKMVSVEAFVRIKFYVASDEPIHVVWRCEVDGDPA